MTENVDRSAWRRELYSGIEDLTNPMSDVDVTCRDEVTFYCHDTVLGENLVLRRTLLSDLQESQERSVNIPFDGPSVKAFLRFLYLGAVEEAELNDNAESLLQLGHMYQEQGLFEAAGAKLVSQVSDDNFDRLLVLADLLGAAELKRCCIEWIWKGPTKLRKAPNYAEITKTHLMDDILLARKKGSCLIALGGCNSDDKTVSDVYLWHPGDQDWTQLTSMTQERWGHTAVGVQGKIYVIGGRDSKGNFLSSMEVLDVQSRTWTQLAPMPKIRGYCLSAHIDGKIYVADWGGSVVVVYHISDKCWSVLPYQTLSGIRGFVALDDCSRFRSYNVDSGSVRDCAPMPTLGTWKLVTLKDKIYSIDGKVSNNATTLSQVYDPASDTWRDIASLNVARASHCVAVLDGRIYAVGGEDADDETLSSVEVYDPSRDCWEFTISLPQKLCGLAVVDV